MRRRVIQVSIIAVLAIVAIGSAALSRPRPVGPLTSEFVCRWDMDARGFRSFIQYKNPRGEVVFESAAAGRCEP